MGRNIFLVSLLQFTGEWPSDGTETVPPDARLIPERRRWYGVADVRRAAMTLAAVQKEIEQWGPEDQDRLAATLSVLRLKRNPEHTVALANRLDDREPAHWLTLDELKRKLTDE
jgi:hypothetical protein